MLSGNIFARKFVRGKSVLSQYYIGTKSGVTPSDDFQSPKIARKFIEPFSKQYPNILETFTRVSHIFHYFLITLNHSKIVFLLKKNIFPLIYLHMSKKIRTFARLM